MCRFFTYFGPDSLMFSAMYNAENSLIEQSKSAKKRRNPVNGDGFGIGWYPAHNDPEPGYYTSTMPAWSDRNLRSLCQKIITPLFFAHIRDASPSMPVTMTNCHPFKYGRFLWMHNGEIAEFQKIKKPLVELLSERAFLQIEGNTDSEFAFALFLDKINFNKDATTQAIEEAIFETIHQIKILSLTHNITSPSSMNFVVSNGQCIVSTRFSTAPKHQPPSLFYSYGKISLDKDGTFFIRQAQRPDSLIISSEPITYDRDRWSKVDRNQLISADSSSLINIRNLSI